MIKTTRATFTPEFRLEASQLVVDQNYKMQEAADAVGIGKSTMADGYHSLEKNVQVVLLEP